jgi:uncharacterized protein (TIGR02646 family)
VIRFKRAAKAPPVLLTKGVSATEEMKRLYDSDPTSYDSGTKTFSIKGSIYRHKTVVVALKKMQSRKCCFCESKFTHVSVGDVEHFRPKKGWRQVRADALGRPGYYWLAYEWTNLFLSCALCNQRFKKNYFPLSDPNNRWRSHNHLLPLEDPLLIDPTSAKANPAELISFRGSVPYAVRGNPYGVATIEFLGLKRRELCEMRRDRLSKLVTLFKVHRLAQKHPTDAELQELAREARGLLVKALRDGAEYAGAARAKLGKFLM